MPMNLVSTVTVGAGGIANIDFSNIPQTGKDLLILLSTRNDRNAFVENIGVSINGSTANQLARFLRGDGSSASSTNSSSLYSPTITSGTSQANTFSNLSFYIVNYASTTANKSISLDAVVENNAVAAAHNIAAASYNLNNAITTISFLGSGYNFVQNSSISLYIIS